MAKDIDIGPVIAGLKRMRLALRPGDLSILYSAFEDLRALPLPPSYLDGVRNEMQLMMGVGQKHDRVFGPTMVYLSFYGVGGLASFLKIGVAKDVRKRLAGHATSNPMPNLWAFTASFMSRQKAEAVEAMLLRNLGEFKAHGEWLHVEKLCRDKATTMADQLSKIAARETGNDVTFAPLEV